MNNPQTSSDTFKEFQAFSDAARDLAAHRLAQRSYNDIFDMLTRQFYAANDNDDPVGDQVVKILLSGPFMSMLKCWQECGRDMVLTKLTYTGE